MAASPNAWILAARPKTLWAATSPVVIGMALAYDAGEFHAIAALLAFTGAVLIQVGTNFYNDYKDFVRGADTAARKGPTRAVQSGLVSPIAMKRATFAVFGAAIVSGIYLMIRGGLPIVVIGASSILFGVLYTAGKYSLANLGVADVFVFIFFGPVAVAGTYYVQALNWPTMVWVAGVGPGLLSVAILLVNNIRDMDDDRASSKKTIVVRLGRRFGYGAYVSCLVIAALLPVYFYVRFDAPVGVLVACLVLPVSIPTIRRLIRTPVQEIEKLNPVLAATGKLLLIYSLLFSVGWIVSPG